MTTIVAICPYCRIGGVRAPASAVGASATCPKCGSSFTVMPSDGVPGWASKPQPAPPPPAVETQPAAALPDVTEPSPVLAPEERPKPAPRKAKATPVPEPEPEPAAAVEPAEPAGAADFGLVIGLVALILVGVAVLASQVPFGRFVALGVSTVGFLAGLAALGGEGRARLAGAGAAGLHLLILVIVLFLPTWLNLDPWRGPQDPDGPKGVMAVPHDGGPPQPADWVDGTAASWTLGDTRVNVHGAFFGPVELDGPKDATRTTKESYLLVTVRVANVGTDRRIGLNGWAAGGAPDGVRLTDPTGKEVKAKTFPAGWTPERERPPLPALFPGKSTDAILVFEPPPPKAGSFQLELPGAAVGSEHPVRFRLPASYLGIRR